MNRADPVFPENAESVFGLGQNGSAAGKLTIFFQKNVGIHMNKGCDGLNILWRNIGPAVTRAAVAALLTFEKIIGRQGFTGHVVSPWRVSGLPGQRISGLRRWEHRRRCG